VQLEVPVHACVVDGGGCGQSASATGVPSVRWQVRVRVWVPVPQVALHAPQVPIHW
jgi:hypothetical protein